MGPEVPLLPSGRLHAALPRPKGPCAAVLLLSSRRGPLPKRRVLLSAVDSLSGRESLSERDGSQAASLPALPCPASIAAARYLTLQHHTHTLSLLLLLLQHIATHRANTPSPPSHHPRRRDTHSTLRQQHQHPPTTTRPTPSPRPNPPPRPPPPARSLARPPVCLAATAITPPTPCIARRRRASQSPVTCETPALASSLRLSHNLALQNGVKSMHAPPSAARRSHWHSAACDRATLAPNKPRHPLTVILRSSSGNTSSW